MPCVDNSSDIPFVDEEEPVAKKATTKARGGGTAENVHKCEELLAELTKQDDAWPFLRPVSKRDVSYLTCIG